MQCFMMFHSHCLRQGLAEATLCANGKSPARRRALRQTQQARSRGKGQREAPPCLLTACGNAGSRTLPPDIPETTAADAAGSRWARESGALP